MTTGIVFDIKKYAIHDGPGIRTTIFFKGCPLKCVWCHNPESIKPEVETIIKTNRKKALDLSYSETKEVFGREVTVDEIFGEIKKDLLFYDDSNGGATFSGGEPLMQIDFLLELVKRCREEEIHTVVDTSGLAKWEDFEKIKNYVDLFLYDIKVMDDEIHKEFTEVSNKQILDNLKKLTESGSKVRIRIPLIPEVTDTENNINATINFVSGLKNIDGIDLLPFNTIYEGKYSKMNLENKLRGTEKQSSEKINELRELIEAAGFTVQVGG